MAVPDILIPGGPGVYDEAAGGSKVLTGSNGRPEVGSPNKVITPTVTVNTAAYVAGDVLGGKLVLTDAVRVAGGKAVLESVHITDAGDQKALIDLLFFDADPTAASTTDHAAFAWSSDVSKCKGHVAVALADYTTIAGVAVASKRGLGLELQSAATANLWCVPVAVGTPDYVASSDLRISFGFLQG